MEILRGAPKIFKHPKGELENIREGGPEILYTSKPTGDGGLLKN